MAAFTASVPTPLPTSVPSGQVLNLDQCLRAAMENNHRRPATALGLEIAQSQHRQALSGYWPQLSIQAGFQHDSKAPNFLFPASNFSIPGQVIQLGPGMEIPLPATNFQIPAQDVKLLDPDTTSASLDATWLLWDGGMRRGLSRQAQAGMEVARSEVRRTDLELKLQSQLTLLIGNEVWKQLRKE